MLVFLRAYVEESNIWDHSAEYLNLKCQEAQASSVTGGSITERLSTSFSGATAPDYLFFPGNAELLPAFVLANHIANQGCRAQVASHLLQQQYPVKTILPQDCDFIFKKLEAAAPHLLGSNLDPSPPLRIPTYQIATKAGTCQQCNSELHVQKRQEAVCFHSFSHCAGAEIQIKVCKACKITYSGPWVVNPSNKSHGKRLADTNMECVFNSHWDPRIAFLSTFMDEISNLIVHCGATFQGLARSIQLPSSIKSDQFERTLSDCWIIYTSVKLLGQNAMSLTWPLQRRQTEKWCRQNISNLAKAFQHKWLVAHSCSKCASKKLGLDGNAKIRTRLCANIDDGVWNCRSLKSHCLTGCQNRPLPGHRFCKHHIHEDDSIWGSDHFLRIWVLLQTPEDRSTTSRNLALTCKRASCAIKFAFILGQNQYPVALLQVKRVARSRRFCFETACKSKFSALHHEVPVRFRKMHAESYRQPTREQIYAGCKRNRRRLRGNFDGQIVCGFALSFCWFSSCEHGQQTA